MKAPPKFVPLTCGHCGQSRRTLNGAWLRWRRERADVSLRAIARGAGLSAAYLSDVENGRRHAGPRAEQAYQSIEGGDA